MCQFVIMWAFLFFLSSALLHDVCTMACTEREDVEGRWMIDLWRYLLGWCEFSDWFQIEESTTRPDVKVFALLILSEWTCFEGQLPLSSTDCRSCGLSLGKPKETTHFVLTNCPVCGCFFQKSKDWLLWNVHASTNLLKNAHKVKMKVHHLLIA